VWRHTWRKNWVKCAVFTGNSAGLRTVPFQSSFTQRTARFTQGIPQFPQFTCRHHDGIISSNSFSRWASHDIYLIKYHILLHILRFLFFFSDNIMADVVSKQQTTALFLSTIVTRTRRHTELTPPPQKKTDKPDGKPVLCQRTFSSVFRAVLFLHSKTAQFNLKFMGPLTLQLGSIEWISISVMSVRAGGRWPVCSDSLRNYSLIQNLITIHWIINRVNRQAGTEGKVTVRQH
jgi:hypothetical protein